MTEYYAKKIMGDEYPGDETIYRHNTMRAERLEALMGEDLMHKAYFGNQPELMKNEFNRVLGEGKFEEFSKCCDYAISENEEEAEYWNNAANRLLEKYEKLKPIADAAR